MPELQALYQEKQDEGINVVGIVADGTDNQATALKIVQKQGVSYSNIVPDQKFMDEFVSLTSAVPITLFVNSEGELVGDEVLGARSKAEFQKMITDTLKSMEGSK